MFRTKRDTGNPKSRTRLLLGLSLAVMLLSSFVPLYAGMQTAHAAETFKTFDGNDYVEVPASAEMQLSTFTAEVRFRTDVTQPERGYLLSKSTGNGTLDHNYAIYVTVKGAIGGGFKATDGKFYQVYSWQLPSPATWHTAKLQYDGSQLILRIDDKIARTLKVGKSPAVSGTGSLYIGADARQDRFFAGDIDYVKIVNTKNNAQVYFNDFGTSPPVNSAAVAVNDWAWTLKNTAKTKNIIWNDSDPDGDSLTVTSVTDPPKGSVTNNGDGTITYTPDPNFVGTDVFQYTISDGQGGTGTAKVTIEVREGSTANTAPSAINDSTTTTKDTAVTTNVLSNDSDPDGDSLTVTSVTNPLNGAATKTISGTIKYTPSAGFVGTDTYQYTVSDGLAADTATVTVSVSDTAPPPPPPPSDSDCATIPVKNLKGVVFLDATLGKSEKAGSSTVLTAYVTESMKYIKSNGFNVVRVPYYWEAYVNDPTTFMAELDLVARTAEANDICVVFSNFHYYTSSYWNLEAEGTAGGKGFPSFVVKSFPTKDNYLQTAGPFWNAFLSNSIVINGRNVWDVQADFIKSVIKKVDNYGSVSGFEILNEPHLFNSQMYEKLGNYHTYMAKEMREVTNKKIFFVRETAWGFDREPNSEYKIVPRGVSGIVYAPHIYAIPYPGTNGMKQMDNFRTWSQQWGTEVFIGELGATTQSEAETLLGVLKSYGFGWSAHSWRKGAANGLGETLYESSTVPPTHALEILTSAMAKIY